MNPPVGLLGGSFDPPHRAHLALARAALAAGAVGSVRLLVAALPPHKAVGTDARHRAAMARLLAEEDARLTVETLELERPGPSYTVDTLRELRRREPERDWRLIIGADMAATFPTWRDAWDVVRLAPPLVAARPGWRLPAPTEATNAGWTPALWQALSRTPLPFDETDLSSTRIRDAFRRGCPEEARAWLTPAVFDYIRRERLYGPEGE